jgi:hypothetical protein
MEDVLYNFLGGILYFRNASFRARAQARWRKLGSRMMIADIGLWAICFALISAIFVVGIHHFLETKV